MRIGAWAHASDKRVILELVSAFCISGIRQQEAERMAKRKSAKTPEIKHPEEVHSNLPVIVSKKSAGDHFVEIFASDPKVAAALQRVRERLKLLASNTELTQAWQEGIGDTNRMLAAYELPSGNIEDWITAAKKVRVPNFLTKIMGDVLDEIEEIAANEEWKAKLVAKEIGRLAVHDAMIVGTKHKTVKRSDEPTDIDVTNIKTVIAKMTARRPAVEASRKAVRDAGFSMSNNLISKAIKIIRSQE